MIEMPRQRLIEALQAEEGLVCLVGAGGKKSTMYRLAALHPGRIGITATVMIPPFPKTLEAFRVVEPQPDLERAVAAAAGGHRIVAFATPSAKHGRLGGVDRRGLAGLHAAAGFDVTLVKADGARSRWIKAPGEREPQIPAGARTVIPVVSAAVIGRPLDERIAHRVDCLSAVSGAQRGEPLTPDHVARLLASAQGALKDAGEAGVVPLINMVDDAEAEAAARAIAERALSLSARFGRVVLASMRRADPLVAVIQR